MEQLAERPRFAEHDRETYDALLALCEQLATEHFAPHYRRSDTEEPVFDGEAVVDTRRRYPDATAGPVRRSGQAERPLRSGQKGRSGLLPA